MITNKLYQQHFVKIDLELKKNIELVLNLWDDQEVGMAHEVKSPENQPQFSQTRMGQYWLGPNKLSNQPEMLSKSCHGILIFFLFNGIFY